MGYPEKKTRVSAVYSKGTLRLVEPLQFVEGEQVEVIIVRRPDPSRWDLARLASVPREDIELAEEGLAAWCEELDRQDHH